MRAAVVSSYDKRRIVALVRKHFSLSNDPEIVFTYGGDGTILQAEHKYSGVPIVPIKKSRICSRCHVYSIGHLNRTIEKIKKGFRTIEREKVEAIFKGKKIYALNEIQMRSKDPRSALRFSVKNGVRGEVIGDGLVAATAYGSTGYYRSIGCKPFKSGVRIGFNNVWPRLPCIEVKKCVVRSLRQDAWIAADNFFLATMKKGDKVVIKESREKARFVVV